MVLKKKDEEDKNRVLPNIFSCDAIYFTDFLAKYFLVTAFSGEARRRLPLHWRPGVLELANIDNISLALWLTPTASGKPSLKAHRRQSGPLGPNGSILL